MQTLDHRDGSAVAEPLAERSADSTAPEPTRDKGLLLVGVFKLSKAVFFASVAAGALHLMHRNVGDVVLRIADALRVDPESHFVGMLMNRADLIDVHRLRQFSLFTSSYAILCVIEGTGLLLEKAWAEYFTVVLTAMALPWESYELFERFSAFKVALLLLNVLVLLYLLWLLKRKKQHRRVQVESSLRTPPTP